MTISDQALYLEFVRLMKTTFIPNYYHTEQLNLINFNEIMNLIFLLIAKVNFPKVQVDWRI